MTYEISVGPKKISDLMSRMDLGIEGVCDQVLICKLKTNSPFSEELIHKHKEALREGLSKYYYVGDIKFIR